MQLRNNRHFPKQRKANRVLPLSIERRAVLVLRAYRAEKQDNRQARPAWVTVSSSTLWPRYSISHNVLQRQCTVDCFHCTAKLQSRPRSIIINVQPRRQKERLWAVSCPTHRPQPFLLLWLLGRIFPHPVFAFVKRDVYALQLSPRSAVDTLRLSIRRLPGSNSLERVVLSGTGWPGTQRSTVYRCFLNGPLLSEWESAAAGPVLRAPRGQAAWLTLPGVVSTWLTCRTGMFHHCRTDMAPLTATKVQFVAFGL